MQSNCITNHTKTCLRHPLDDVDLVSLLTACAKERNLLKGSQLHATFLQKGKLINDLRVSNALISMYAKCGALPKAQDVFGELLIRDKVSWNALSAGYAQQRYDEGALSCFQQMQQEGISPDAITFTCILKAFGNLGSIVKGKEIHARIVTEGFWEHDVVLCTALVDMYSKCGALVKAKQVFDELPVRNEVSWNVLIAGFCEFDHYEEALDCFEQMKCKGMSPNAMSFACILKVYGSFWLAERGEKIHSEIVRKGLVAGNTLLGSALMDMYLNQGALTKAQTVFDEFGARDTVAWTGLIKGYCQYGYSEEALQWYEKMRSEGSSPNAVTFACTLKACGSIRAADKGKEIHVEIVRKGLLGNDTVLGSALADMYAKCGALIRAREVFDALPDRDAASWNALIVNYCEWCCDEKALDCFEQMKLEGVSPDTVTFSCILKAYGSIGAAEKGQEVHAEIARKGFLEYHIDLGNALVCMYVFCGTLAKAEEVFCALPARDMVSWNSLLSGYCEHGHSKEALALFEQLKCKGFSPDAVTFVCVLRACSSMGAAAEGELYFRTMTESYGVVPCLEHNTCMVGLFMCMGDFDKAMALVERTPSSRNLSSWVTLLCSCQKLGNVKLGSVAFNSTVQLS